MAESDRNGVRRVEGVWRFVELEEPANHALNLHLARASVSTHGLLDGRRRILDHLDTGLRCSE